MSFKLKLVASFVALTLLPLGGAFWGFDSLVRRSETRRADARLEAELRATVNAYQAQVLAVGRTATQLASDPDVQRALRDRDRDALRALVAANPNLRLRVDRRLDLGAVPEEAVVRTVAVVAHGRVLGRVSVALPLDRALVERVASRAGIEGGDTLVLTENGRVAVGPASVRGEPLALHAGRPGAESIGDARYRVLSATPIEERGGVSFAVLTPQGTIDAAVRRAERTLLAALLAMLALVGLVAYGLSRSIVGSLGRLARAAEAIAAGRLDERVPVRGRDEFGQLARAFNDMAAQLEARMVELEAERTRLSQATSRIGDALGATHDPEQLLTVLCEAAVEATGAYGGVVRGPGDVELVRRGDPEAGLQVLELPLQASRHRFGTLVLAAPEFGTDARETASLLVSQAVSALENARLHRQVEQQARVDGLTGLANRRACEERLREELHRSDRLDGELAVVMADLDNFKEINDRFGHPVGDLVLREFARRLRETVREIDVAGRWGGEEFCLVLLGTDAAGAARVAERARAALAETPVVTPDGAALRVTASFGVAAFPEQPSESSLVAAADAALYRAKRAGKNRVATATEPVAQ
ncbi:MAG TPA: diguanylate cyclase [Gaiellaceae bacterium]|nr:diguanylate cyclase [Gaiellaceae bacterium]